MLASVLTRSTAPVSLFAIPTDVLYCIFSYFDRSSCKVCRLCVQVFAQVFLNPLFYDSCLSSRAVEPILAAPSRLKTDRAFVCRVLSTFLKNYEAVKDLDPWETLFLQIPLFQEDKVIVLNVMRKNPNLFKSLIPKLRNDRDIVLASIQAGGYKTLKYSDLSNDRTIVLAAIEALGHNALEYASETLRDDREFIYASMAASNGMILCYASKKLLNDPKIVSAAIRTSQGAALRYASRELRNDRTIVLEAIKVSQGEALNLASRTLCNDHEIVRAAIEEGDGSALELASAELRNDSGLIRLAAQQARMHPQISPSYRLAYTNAYGNSC